jgi:hypothetical protein
MKKTVKEIIGVLLFAALFIGVGIIMVLNPDLGGYEPHGRHLLIKKLVALVWGRPAGIIGIILGLLMVLGIFKGEEKPEQLKEG